ncbi:MAG: divalent-cation tolerance protein CutA [Candidatus Peribacteria bacterium]|nr:MAG: divalent-cation tolerance protein CutA [Candidatus Peribacteria bacterium]
MEEAEKVSSHLLQQKSIACVNFFPIKSSYWWKGNIESSDEIVSLLKTKNENWEKVKSEIMKIHPYETPCIIKMSVEANDEYESWINKEAI